MPSKKLDPMTRLRRLLLEARDALAHYSDKEHDPFDKLARERLLARLDRALTDSTAEQESDK